jgi:excisionase family DNA binding protein
MNKRRRKRRSPRGKAQFIEPEGVAGLPPNLTVSEFAVQQRCTPQHVRNMIRRGEVRAIRFGNLFLIPLPEAQRLNALPAAG